jgi:hypothetical protein
VVVVLQIFFSSQVVVVPQVWAVVEAQADIFIDKMFCYKVEQKAILLRQTTLFKLVLAVTDH